MKLLLKKKKRERETKTVKEDKHLHLCTGETLAVLFLEENRLITETREGTENTQLYRLSQESRKCHLTGTKRHTEPVRSAYDVPGGILLDSVPYHPHDSP